MKRNLFITLAVALILSGCASPSEVKTTLEQQKRLEDSGWNKVFSEVDHQCGQTGKGKTPPSKKEMVKRAECLNSLIGQYVVPNAAFPEIIQDSMHEIEQVAKDYEAGKISSEQLDSRMNSLQATYDKKWVDLANQKIIDAANKQETALMWAGAISNVGATSYQYRQEAMQQQAAGRAAAYEASRPKSVICRPLGYGGRVECYEQ